jgi:hypothetical protein
MRTLSAAALPRSMRWFADLTCFKEWRGFAAAVNLEEKNGVVLGSKILECTYYIFFSPMGSAVADR